MKGKNAYRVPDGYFASLQERLSAIPQQEQLSAIPQQEQLSAIPQQERLGVIPQQEAAPGVWVRVRPYLALAAAFAVLVTLGTALLRWTAAPAEDDWDSFAVAQMMPRTEPDAFYDATLAESLAPALTYDDIAQYLLETGVSLEELENDETDD